MSRGARLVLALVYLATAFACQYLPESGFDLAPESRLPKWFAIPPNLTRPQLAVHMDYYVLPWGRRANFTLLGPQREVLAEVTGKLLDSEPRTLLVHPEGFPPGYPRYEVIVVGAIKEIVEHRRPEPIFYVFEERQHSEPQSVK